MSEKNALWVAIIMVATLILLLLVLPARAHEWYPWSCCSDKDCRPLDQEKGEWVREEGQFYVIWDGRRYPKDMTKPSPDGRYHFCESDTKSIKCFFAPPPAT